MTKRKKDGTTSSVTVTDERLNLNTSESSNSKSGAPRTSTLPPKDSLLRGDFSEAQLVLRGVFEDLQSEPTSGTLKARQRISKALGLEAPE